MSLNILTVEALIRTIWWLSRDPWVVSHRQPYTASLPPIQQLPYANSQRNTNIPGLENGKWKSFSSFRNLSGMIFVFVFVCIIIWVSLMISTQLRERETGQSNGDDASDRWDALGGWVDFDGWVGGIKSSLFQLRFDLLSPSLSILLDASVSSRDATCISLFL